MLLVDECDSAFDKEEVKNLSNQAQLQSNEG